MLSSITTTTAMGGLFLAGSASAGWTNSCRNACITVEDPNMLVTECLISGGDNGNPNDQNYQWAQFDLNQVLEYAQPFINYRQNGNFANADSGPCSSCSVTSGQLSCLCSGAPVATLDLDTWISDATGVLCFANHDFGPICGTSTSRTC